MEWHAKQVIIEGEGAAYSARKITSASGHGGFSNQLDAERGTDNFGTCLEKCDAQVLWEIQQPFNLAMSTFLSV